MRHTESLKRLRSFFQRGEENGNPDVLSGPTLIEQEPDLAQETARYNISASSWAAGGHPTD